MKKTITVSLLAAAAITAPLSAQFYSSLNPSVDLNAYGITSGTGIVFEILGNNGAHVASQLSAAELYNGFFDYGTGGGIFANTIFGYTGGATTPLPGVAEALGIIGEQYGWDAFDFGSGIAAINIEMTLFDFQGINNLGEDYLMINGLEVPIDLGFVYTGSGTVETASFLIDDTFGTFLDPIAQDLSNGYLNLALNETNPDTLAFGGYTPVDFVGPSGQIDITRPVGPIQITAPIPEPSFIGLISFGFIATLIGTYRRRR